jgi:hypothetical protein
MTMQAGMADARAARLNAAGGGREASSGRATDSWFEAPTRFGSLWLCIAAADGPARHAAGAALLLRRCEALLAALDPCSPDALAWRWATARAAPAASASAQACVDVHLQPLGSSEQTGHAALATEALGEIDTAGDEPIIRCQLVCPWTWLRSLPAPGERWRATLQWPQVQAVLTVARLRLSAGELCDIEAGGLVILATSLQPAWHGVLRAAAEPCDAGIAVSLTPLLAPQVARQRFAPGVLAPTGDRSGSLCEMRLELPADVPGDWLTGWQPLTLGPVGPGATLWRCADEGEPPVRIAGGTLVPWGEGWALLVHHLAETIPR